MSQQRGNVGFSAKWRHIGSAPSKTRFAGLVDTLPHTRRDFENRTSTNRICALSVWVSGYANRSCGVNLSFSSSPSCLKGAICVGQLCDWECLLAMRFHLPSHDEKLCSLGPLKLGRARITSC